MRISVRITSRRKGSPLTVPPLDSRHFSRAVLHALYHSRNWHGSYSFRRTSRTKCIPYASTRRAPCTRKHSAPARGTELIQDDNLKEDAGRRCAVHLRHRSSLCERRNINLLPFCGNDVGARGRVPSNCIPLKVPLRTGSIHLKHTSMETLAHFCRIEFNNSIHY
jgi:hypothetical protein